MFSRRNVLTNGNKVQLKYRRKKALIDKRDIFKLVPRVPRESLTLMTQILEGN